MRTLKDAKLGKFYFVSSVKLENIAVARRLLELGFTTGEKVKVERKSISGGTILVQVRGYLLSLRTSVASNILLCDEA